MPGCPPDEVARLLEDRSTAAHGGTSDQRIALSRSRHEAAAPLFLVESLYQRGHARDRARLHRQPSRRTSAPAPSWRKICGACELRASGSVVWRSSTIPVRAPGGGGRRAQATPIELARTLAGARTPGRGRPDRTTGDLSRGALYDERSVAPSSAESHTCLSAAGLHHTVQRRSRLLSAVGLVRSLPRTGRSCLSPLSGPQPSRSRAGECLRAAWTAKGKPKVPPTVES